ncbi:MAG: hypothetical protein PHT40_03250 [Patescibacteria group bacterium]|nr:hypothetical protein [Patescibacteria group bacterium]
MSVRIILNNKTILQAGVHMCDEGLHNFFKNIRIDFSGGEIFWNDSDDILLCAVPAALKEFAIGFSSYNLIVKPPGSMRRICGIYQYKSATATVDDNPNSVAESLKIWGSNLADGQELFRLIRAGKIWPVDNWEKEQKPNIQTLRVRLSQNFYNLRQGTAQKIQSTQVRMRNIRQNIRRQVSTQTSRLGNSIRHLIKK